MHYMLELVRKREVRKAHQVLSLMSLASQGDGKAIRNQLRALKKEAT